MRIVPQLHLGAGALRCLAKEKESAFLGNNFRSSVTRFLPSVDKQVKMF